ncbi:MAG: type II toxin-antitoxin system VapC family toxin [Acidobacteria bacterium]|nr:type II toxin-antitoxin system VapC family toxin [Acidobacteriota bacterium]
MRAYFLDSSAIVKRYMAETGTVWVYSLFNAATGNKLYATRLAGVEVIAAIARRRRGKSIAAKDAADSIKQFRFDFISDFIILEVTTKLVDRAIRLADSYALRGYDAVPLASALEANDIRLVAHAPPLTFVAADVELDAAAIAEGLRVEDPNAQP